MALCMRRIILAALAAGGVAIAGYGVPVAFSSNTDPNGTAVVADDDDDGWYWGDDDD